MLKTEELKVFVERVMQMRSVQKEFFRTRNYSLMQQSKALEKEVDERASKLMAQLKEEEQAELNKKQPMLFGDHITNG